MSAIHDLISQVTDPRLRDRLAAEWAKASKDKKFGLVFEDHLPELLPLHKALFVETSPAPVKYGAERMIEHFGFSATIRSKAAKARSLAARV